MFSRTITKIWDNFLNDTLFRNSLYLMATTGIMGLFGFIFWTIATHIFNPSEIGLGTTLISSMTMISSMSLLGFNNTFIRFLPTSPNKNRDINSGTIIVVILSILIGLIYVFAIPFITPNLNIIHSSALYALLFVLMVVATSLNSLTDSVFIAYRSTQYVLLTDGIIMSILRVIFPIFFVGVGAYGVFLASGIATFLGLIASVIILIYKFNFIPKLDFDSKKTKKVLSYSFLNYIGSLLSMSPTLLLPIIIINHLGPESAGYFFLAFMLINLLYTISASVSQSLFAEGSYGDNVLKILIKRSLIILGTILMPASIFLIFFGSSILHLFGKSYSTGAAQLIVMLAITSPIIASFNIGSTLLKIRQQMYSVVFINALYALTIYTLATLWVSKGLVWVGYAWVMGNLIAALCAFILIYIYRHLPTASARIHDDE